MDRTSVVSDALTEPLESARKRLDVGRLEQADEIYQPLVSAEFPEASEEAISSLRCILRLALDLGDAWCRSSEGLIRSGKMEEGIVAFDRAAELKSDIARLHERLGDAYLQLWDFDNGIAAYHSALRLRPDFESLKQKLDATMEQKNQPENVLTACRAAIARSNNPAEARLRLANAQRAYRMLDDAIAEYRHVIELQPNSAAAHNNLGVALKDCGRVAEALTELRRAVELAPRSAVIQSNLLYSFSFNPEDDKQANLSAHREWHARQAAHLTNTLMPHMNDRSPGRPLRIGYVSPDFREHCQAFFTVPLLRSHDPSQVEIYCYADVAKPDAITDRLRGYAKVWRDTLGLSDQRVCDLIRADRIDILVDLTMHMANNRQMAFARKPAPIQITWLAYPGTTGQTAIDYRISDPYLDPPDEEAMGYSEQTVRLPETFWCYDPLRPAEPTAALPAIRNGFVTFGCLNNYCKVNDHTLRMWGEVLRRVPDSRFILLAPPGGARRHALQMMNVNEDRIEFVDYRPRPEYLKQYERIDICLDTFPYNGHTTSLDSLWMGVPVISLCGKSAPSRGGFSQASNLKLTHLVGHSTEEFVTIAAKLAENLNELADLRSTLRQKITTSPLMDAPRFARNMEALYRNLWRQWIG